jgi:serine protease Do
MRVASFRIVATVAAAIVACQARSIRADGPASAVPAELLAIRAQPAVFRVLCFARFEVEYPKSMSADIALLKQEYVEEQRKSAVPADGKRPAPREKSQSDFFWERIAADGPKYLKVSEESERGILDNVLWSTGTAFAIDPTGLLLTNAHVVGDPPPDVALKVLTNPDYFAAIFADPMERTAVQLSRSLGGAPPQALCERIAGGMMATLAQSKRVKIEGKFAAAAIALYFATDYDVEDAYWKSPRRQGLLLRPAPAQPIALPVKVVAVGESYPGKDVAILQALRKRDVSGQLAPAPALRLTDTPDAGLTPPPAFISLPLGDSDEVLDGAPVQAMGFPGQAYTEGVMRPEAAFRVSCQNGQIGQTKVPMRGGWDAFAMTADISHGDSGGPVLDKNGRVIALNVAGTEIGSHTVAVPINLAKDLMRKAGIKAQPGAITQLWDSALALFAQGRYRDAKVLLEAVAHQRDPLFSNAIAAVRTERSSSPKTLTELFGRDTLNLDPYVKAMIERCDRKLRPEGRP